MSKMDVSWEKAFNWKKRPTERQIEAWYYGRTKLLEFGHNMVPVTPVSKRKIRAMWRCITNKPLPKIEGYLLSDQNFALFYRKTANLKTSRLVDVIEHGRSIKGSETAGFTRKNQSGYSIFIRWKFYSIDCLKHELLHIASGDLEKFSRLLNKPSEIMNEGK